MYTTEGHAGDGRQLFQRVCDALDRVGFRMRDGGLGLAVESTPEGVRVRWRQRHVPLRSASYRGPAPSGNVTDDGYGRGVHAAMVIAVTAALGQAGYRVCVEDGGLLVAADDEDR